MYMYLHCVYSWSSFQSKLNFLQILKVDLKSDKKVPSTGTLVKSRKN